MNGWTFGSRFWGGKTGHFQRHFLFSFLPSSITLIFSMVRYAAGISFESAKPELICVLFFSDYLSTRRYLSRPSFIRGMILLLISSFFVSSLLFPRFRREEELSKSDNSRYVEPEAIKMWDNTMCVLRESQCVKKKKMKKIVGQIQRLSVVSNIDSDILFFQSFLA